MNTEYILQAKPRESIGTATSKKIRRQNGIPAVVYGDVDNSNIVLDANEVAKQVRDSGFYSSVIKLTIDKNTIDVILKDLQRDPRKSNITHMDFFAVDKNKAVVVNADKDASEFRNLNASGTVTCGMAYVRRNSAEENTHKRALQACVEQGLCFGIPYSKFPFGTVHSSKKP